MILFFKQQSSVTIIGAGIAGCVSALYLSKHYQHINIYEARPDPRQSSLYDGRSINLTIAKRGLSVLQDLYLTESVLANAIPLEGRIIHYLDETTAYQAYGNKKHHILYSISRNKLVQILLNYVEEDANISVYFNCELYSIDFNYPVLSLFDKYHKIKFSVYGDIVIGCDGSSSVLRELMYRNNIVDYTKEYLEHNYKELILSTVSTEFSSAEPNSNSLHVWPRNNFMMNGFPNLDSTYSCLLFAPFNNSFFSELDSEEKISDFLMENFPDLSYHVSSLASQYSNSKNGTLSTVRCSPWHLDGKIILIGDAAHAIVPFHGQGMNCALEDCSCLEKMLIKHNYDTESAFRDFFELRKRESDSIAELSLNNYNELKKSLLSKDFLQRKELEKQLTANFPSRYVPSFHMVCFEDTPYSTAYQYSHIQKFILDELCKESYSLNNIDSHKVSRIVYSCLPKKHSC